MTSQRGEGDDLQRGLASARHCTLAGSSTTADCSYTLQDSAGSESSMVKCSSTRCRPAAPILAAPSGSRNRRTIAAAIGALSPSAPASPSLPPPRSPEPRPPWSPPPACLPPSPPPPPDRTAPRCRGMHQHVQLTMSAHIPPITRELHRIRQSQRPALLPDLRFIRLFPEHREPMI